MVVAAPSGRIRSLIFNAQPNVQLLSWRIRKGEKDEKEMEEEEKQQQQQQRRSSIRNKFTHTLLKKSLPIDGAMSSRSGESVSRPVS